MNKKGGLTDLFLFMIISFIIIVISAVFIYLSSRVNTELHNSMDGMMFGDKNATLIINDSMGKLDQTLQALYWISAFLIFGMILSIFIGSYMVTTRPVFFVPYIFILIIAVIVSVALSNAYEQIIADPTLASTYNGFIMPNFIMAYLPIWISIIGVAGAIIMYSRMGSRESQMMGGYYG